MTDRPLIYTEFAPGESVRDVALTYWSFTVRVLPHRDFVHRVWPDGCVTLTLVCANGHGVGAHLLGVRQVPYEVPLHEGVRYWGVRFRPEAGARWLGVSATKLRDQNVHASTILGDGVMTLAETVAALDTETEVAATIDRWIAARTPADFAVDALVRSAVAAIVATNGQGSIAEIARDVGVSPRALQRRFGGSVGLSPKAFAMLRRGRSALKRVLTDGTGPDVGGWTGVALASGFADQAHFAREVARMTRFVPTRLRERLDTIAHERLID